MPSAPIVSDEEFIRLFHEGGISRIVEETGCNIRAAQRRRRTLERRYKTRLVAPTPNAIDIPSHPKRIRLKVWDGVVLVGSDAHYWPGPPTTIHRAFCRFAKDLAPQVIVLNGDVLDFPQVSRHARVNWDEMPTVKDEIEAAQERTKEIELAKPLNCRTIWTLGNHDQRFETKLVTTNPEMGGVPGTSLVDHFPTWEPCWSVWINDTVAITHRFRSGVHAPRNNTLNAGISMVTGHLHSAKIQPITDYRGTRYGVDTGCMADPYADQFDYLEDNPRDWRSAMCILTFQDGQLLQPELALKWADGIVQFRGELIDVSEAT